MFVSVDCNFPFRGVFTSFRNTFMSLLSTLFCELLLPDFFITIFGGVSDMKSDCLSDLY